MASRIKRIGVRVQQLDTRRVPSLSTGEAQRTRGDAWMRTRERILMRDAGLCRCDECRESGAVRLADEVDHRTPLWAGGTNDESNLQAINRDCHQRKTAREARERAQRGQG